MTKTIVMVSCLIVAVSIGFKGYLETRVNTRFDQEKMVQKTGLDVPDRYWGSYRPGTYFGMKTRDPYSPVFGLMWYFPHLLTSNGGGIRHWCEQGDNLKHYTWTEHDGRNFGVQEIDDGPYRLETSFVKRPGGNHGGDWTARITVTSNSKQPNDEVSLIVYTAIEEKTEGWIKPYLHDGRYVSGMKGETSGLGSFKLTLFNQTGDLLSDSYLSTAAPGLHLLKETVLNSLRIAPGKPSKQKRLVFPGELLRSQDGTVVNPNFIALQVTARMPFEIILVYESGSFHSRPDTLIGGTYERELNQHRKKFSQRFENTFHLSEKGWLDKDIDFAKAALSNMIGSIGYFYGASRVSSAHTEGTVPYWKAPLYTAVPSRSFFPRGFLWDEAFHGLLISTWDLDIEIDIMQHWFDLMNIEGWIPREQILGAEALSKVPEEFVTQVNTNANPPVFFLTLRYIINNFGEQLRAERKLSEIDRLFPRLQAWYDWFNTTQNGPLPSAYRWRGRNENTNKELNPRTLTSGLDDYPRASHPSDHERHVDLRSWMALASAALAETAQLLGRSGERFERARDTLTDPSLLNKLHWSENSKRFSDFGLHTDFVILKRPPTPQRHPGRPVQTPEMIRIVLQDPSLSFVDSTFGYVSLFPFLLEILPPDSPELGHIFKDLKKPELLWTSFGLRSLSTTSPLYQKRNTEHDPPYWRGAIWMNINYLAVKALHHYSHIEGPYQKEAQSLYAELRGNLIKNVMREYRRTGFIWEQYNDKTGEGMGCRPFTGWSALTVMLMAEIY